MRNEVAFKERGKARTEPTATENGWTVGQRMKMSEMDREPCLDKMEELLPG